MLAFSICSKFLGLKRQIILPMYEDYQQGRREFTEARQAFADGDRSRTAEFVGNFQTISPIWLPTESLEKQIIERISIRGRGLAAAVDLISVVDALDQSIKNRTDLISEFYKDTTSTRMDLALKYYGLQNTRGVTDEKFYSNAEALYKQTDDCIFFSKVLADDLFEYERRLCRRSMWRGFRLPVPKLVREKWNFPETRRLLPNESNYVDWLRGFPKVPSRFTRLRKWLFSRTKRLDSDVAG
jgi:hypothetical protein